MKQQVMDTLSTSAMLQKRQGLIYYLSFLVWPFGVMIDALRHWRQPWAKNVFWLFCIFFGYTFLIAGDEIGSADSARYAESLRWYATSDLDFKDLMKSFYSESSSSVDIVQPLLTYLVSRITIDPHMLFATFAFVFGFFHSRNLWYILNQTKGKLSLTVILFIAVFILLNPIWNINGFRMWTGAQVFIFGVLPYLFEGKTKSLIWCTFAVLFHFTFIIPLGIVLIYILLKNRPSVYLALFIITSFVKELDLQAVQSFLSFLPSALQSRVMGYTNVDYVESVAIAGQALNWYIPMATKGLGWIIYIYVFFYYFFEQKFLKNNKPLMNIFCFSLLFYSLANIFSLVPSGGRFLSIGSILFYIFFIISINISSQKEGIKVLNIASVPIATLFCLVLIRIGLDFIGLPTLIGNPFFAFMGIESVQLIAEIKGLL